MKPKRIILIRHGQSEGKVDPKIYNKTPDYKLNLSATGRVEARDAGVKIKEIIRNENLYVYRSSYNRVRQTYEEIKKSIIDNVSECVEDPRLREQDWGHLRDVAEGKEIDKERDEYGPFHFRIPDGESVADVYDRVSTFIETMHRDFAKLEFPKNVLIVTHGMTLRLFLMRWLHWSVEDFEKLKNPKNCQIVIMEQSVYGHFELISKLEEKMKLTLFMIGGGFPR